MSLSPHRLARAYLSESLSSELECLYPLSCRRPMAVQDLEATWRTSRWDKTLSYLVELDLIQAGS